MKKVSALFVSAPVVFGALAHFLRERDTLVIMFLTGWIIFTGIALVWAFLIRRERHGLAALCAVLALAQFAAFALLFALVDSRAKARGRMAVVSASSFANNPAAGKAGIARLFAIEHHCPGLPEPGR